MALAFTTFLHRGTSVVSVSCFFSSASSSGVSFGALLSSRPQKHISAFLQQPGFLSESTTQYKTNNGLHLLNVDILVCFGCLNITFIICAVIIIIITNPVVLFDVHSLFSTVPQAPAKSVQLGNKTTFENA